MRRSTLRALSILAGVLLIIAGVVCLCHQETAVLSAGILLGANLLDGILTVLLSLFLLFNRAFTLLSLPMLFAMWLLFSGVMRVVSSVELRALGMRRWGWVTLLGVVLLVAGFVGLMDPWLGARALGATLGLCFILEGLDSILSGWLTGR